MKYEAVIFDLEGALVHTKPAYRYIVVGSALSQLNRSAPHSEIDDFWFLSDADRARIIKERWHLDPEKFWPVFRKFDTIDLRGQYSEVYSDAGVLQVLGKRGVKLGIVSAAPAHIIKLEVEMLNHQFDAVISAQLEEEIEPKPSPEGLEKCLNLLQVGKQGAAYIGNARCDMEMARNAQVFSVLIERGEYNFGRIEADLTITSLKALEIIV